MRKIATLVILLLVRSLHAQTVTVSPNPFTNTIKIVIADEKEPAVKTVSILDLTLKPALEPQILRADQHEVAFETTSLSSGYYFVKIYSEKTERTFRVLKE